VRGFGLQKISCLAVSLPAFLWACGGGNSVTGTFEESISSVVLIGGAASFGRVSVISSADQVSPQSYTISAGFGDADEIEEGAIVSLGDGRLLIDVRGAEERIDRTVRALVSVRTPQSLEFIGVAAGELGLSPIDTIDSIRLRGGVKLPRFGGQVGSLLSPHLKLDGAHIVNG